MSWLAREVPSHAGIMRGESGFTGTAQEPRPIPLIWCWWNGFFPQFGNRALLNSGRSSDRTRDIENRFEIRHSDFARATSWSPPRLSPWCRKQLEMDSRRRRRSFSTTPPCAQRSARRSPAASRGTTPASSSPSPTRTSRSTRSRRRSNRPAGTRARCAPPLPRDPPSSTRAHSRARPRAFRRRRPPTSRV